MRTLAKKPFNLLRDDAIRVSLLAYNKNGDAKKPKEGPCGNAKVLMMTAPARLNMPAM